MSKLVKVSGGVLVERRKLTAMLKAADTIPKAVNVSNYAKHVTQALRSARSVRADVLDLAELWIAADRKLGAMLSTLDKHKGGRPLKTGCKPQPVSLKALGLEKTKSSRTQNLAAVPKRKVRAFLKACLDDENKEPTPGGCIRFAADKRDRDGSPPPAPPVGTYRCIVIDPPWEMEKIVRDARPLQGGFEYDTMSEEELEDMELPAADGCHLYCWTTHKHLPTALRLVEAWGFNYECLMTWVKNVGFTPFSWMRTTEHVLFCRKGSLDLLKLGKPLHFSAKVREHSRKPDEFYELVRQVTPGPRIDMFAREKHKGFKVWGDEPGKFDE